MKTKKTYIVLLALTIVLPFVCGCKKNDPFDEYGLRKPTQGGHGYFGCQVNGENWIAKGIYRVGGIVKKDTLIISASVLHDNFERYGSIEALSISVLNTEVKVHKVYKLNDPENQYGLFGTDKNCFLDSDIYRYGSAKSADGEVIFTKIDKSTRIVSGTFWFNVITEKCGEKTIRHGRFDINIGSNFLLD